MDRLGRYFFERNGRTADFVSVHEGHLVLPSGIVRSVRVRRMLPEHRERTDLVELLLEDVRQRNRLAHPGVTVALDVERHEGQWLAIDERLPGHDLGSIIAAARASNTLIGADIAAHLAIQLLDVLEHAHRAGDDDGKPIGLVHRDLCPANIFVTSAGHLKLSGFEYASTSAKPSPPQPGAVVPRYGYLSPEQALGGEVDARADLFSVGLILFELLAGVPAYEAKSDLEALACAQRGEVRPLSDVKPSVDRELAAIVVRALAVERDARFAAASELRDALASVLFSRDPLFSSRRVAAWLALNLANESAQARRVEIAARAEAEREANASSSTEVERAARASGDRQSDPGSRRHLPKLPSSNEPASDPAPVSSSNPRQEMPLRADPKPSPESPPRVVPLPRASTLTPRTRQLGMGLSVLVVLAGAAVGAFLLWSEKNRSLVERRIRAAFVGREPGGTLTIESLPPGAQLFIDDEDTHQRTPVTVENLESGLVHTLRLELEGEPALTSTIGIEAGKKRTVTLAFPNAVVALAIKSDPPGAAVSIDGKRLAITPATLMVRVGHELQVTLSHTGFKDYETRLSTEHAKPIDVDVKLQRLDPL